MIVVTGATGKLGRLVVEHLLARVPASAIAAATRDPARAADLAGRGVAIRRADFADPPSLDAAFAGASRLLVVSADRLGDEARALHRAAIAAARRAGVPRILYTSHQAARAGSPFAPAATHAATETDLAASGLSYLSLRHGFYAESCLHIAAAGLRAGELRTPEDGPVAWTARADLAEADAAILAAGPAGDTDRQGLSPPLTAGQAVTMSELAAIASAITGREIRHTTLTDDAWRDERIAAGTPPLYADLLLGTFRAARRGDFAATDPALENLLGRKPTTIRGVLAEELR